MKIKSLLIVLVTLAAAGSILTCAEPTVTSLSKEAILKAVSIGTYDLTDAIPDAIDSRDWDNDSYSMFSAETGYANFRLENDTKIQRIRTTISSRATSQWGLGTRSSRPGVFYDTRVPISFESDEYIYIKVTSEDSTNTQYYRFYAKVLSLVTHLNTIEIAGRSKEAKTPAKKYIDAEEQRIDIAVNESAGPTIDTFLFDPNSSVKFAAVKKADEFTPDPNVDPEEEQDGPELNLVSPGTPLTFDDGDLLYIQVTAENTVTQDYYKFRVMVGHIAEIKDLFMVDEVKNARTQIYNKGLFSNDWSKIGPGGFATADLPADGFKVDIQCEDNQATKQYLLIEDNIGAPLPDFANGSLSGNVKFSYTAPKLFVLAIKVTAPKGEVLYYAIKADILAAIITKQPKSAWYYADYMDFDNPNSDKYGNAKYYPQTYPLGTDQAPISADDRANMIRAKKAKQTVAPLTVELDRSGNYTYQWYEADSWYGFYGRHGTSIDEKNNLTTVNGGPRQYFYLVEADKPQHPFSSATAWTLTGQTSSTFTPPTDWIDVPIKLPRGASQNHSVPYDPTSSEYNGATDQVTPEGGWPSPAPNHVNFITGATNECRYYWCEITDQNTGLKVISERALIITETHPAMEHFIFELTDLPRKKNDAPFKELRELHKIPLVKGNTSDSIFPAGFDPGKFESMVAHARFFLPDGRPWTQNWTHGDIHFGYNDNTLTWWQNNLGANGGAIPLHSPHSSKGGLERSPEWIGFAPSGDPNKRVPAANWDASWPDQPPGIPPPVMQDITLDGGYVQKKGDLPKGVFADKGNWPSEIAQGWFAGFIELLEVRFSTSPPKEEAPED
jgi:hypothetical protein